MTIADVAMTLHRVWTAAMVHEEATDFSTVNWRKTFLPSSWLLVKSKKFYWNSPQKIHFAKRVRAVDQKLKINLCSGLITHAVKLNIQS